MNFLNVLYFIEQKTEVFVTNSFSIVFNISLLLYQLPKRFHLLFLQYFVFICNISFVFIRLFFVISFFLKSFNTRNYIITTFVYVILLKYERNNFIQKFCSYFILLFVYFIIPAMICVFFVCNLFALLFPTTIKYYFFNCV